MAHHPRRHRRRRILFLLPLLVLLAAAFLYWSNTALQITRFDPVFRQLPEGFDGCRVAVLSDLHGASFGADNEKLFAAAARLGEPLAEWGESVHILPQTYKKAVSLDQNGTCVLMKSCKYMDTVKAMLRESGRRVTAVENCGMPNEKVYRSLEEIPDDAGYYTLIIAKEARS